MIALLALFALISPATRYGGRKDPLLYSHVVAIITGYVGAFVAGILGCIYLISPKRSFWRANGVFLRVAAGAIAVGYVLGMIWSHFHWGRTWSGDEREMGGLNSLVWTLLACAAHYFGRAGNRPAILMSIGGNIIVCQAWFEPFVIANPARWLLWPVAVFVAVNFCFLGAGLTGFKRRVAQAR